MPINNTAPLDYPYIARTATLRLQQPCTLYSSVATVDDSGLLVYK